jgi:hypothetical protein
MRGKCELPQEDVGIEDSTEAMVRMRYLGRLYEHILWDWPYPVEGAAETAWREAGEKSQRGICGLDAFLYEW